MPVMPSSSRAAASPPPKPRTLRFGGGESIHPCFPSDLLPSVRWVDQFQKRALGFQKGNSSELRVLLENWEHYDAQMEGLQDSFKNKAAYEQKVQEKLALLEKRHQLVLQKYPEISDIVFDGINEDTVQVTSPAKSKKAEGASGASSSQEDEVTEDSQSAQSQAAANWTPKNERTRLKVLMDLGKQYITRGPLLSDSLWSVGIGAVLAIGSPVMAVTIPTTFAFFLAGRAALALMHFCQDPKGNSIDAKYQKWIEKDAEKLKKQEESRASE